MESPWSLHGVPSSLHGVSVESHEVSMESPWSPMTSPWSRHGVLKTMLSHWFYKENRPMESPWSLHGVPWSLHGVSMESHEVSMESPWSPMTPPWSRYGVLKTMISHWFSPYAIWGKSLENSSEFDIGTWSRHDPQIVFVLVFLYIKVSAYTSISSNIGDKKLIILHAVQVSIPLPPPSGN